MKKIILSIIALMICSLVSRAQTRLALYEEFAAANFDCGFCIITYPQLDSLTSGQLPGGAQNASKVLMVKYLLEERVFSPLPYTDIPDTQDSADALNRLFYYGDDYLHYGYLDGIKPDVDSIIPGSSNYFSQGDIDSEAAIASPFNITVTEVWNATYDSVTATINITCVTPFAPPSADLHLRVALLETLNLTIFPTGNGQTYFPNAVRAMYPNGTGTSLANSWTAGQMQTITITGSVPSFVNKTSAPFVAVWIQDDNNKKVAQAAMAAPLSTIPIHANIKSVTPQGIICAASSTYTPPHTVTLVNTGSATLTSATIYYSIDGGAYQSLPWTGSIAAGDSVIVTMPVTTVNASGAGHHSIKDSVAMPNGAMDTDPINNVAGSTYFVENSPGLAMPFNGDMETNLTQYYSDDLDMNGNTWELGVTVAVLDSYLTSDPVSNIGHNGSGSAAFYYDFQYYAGEKNILWIPNIAFSAPSAVDFWVAYRQFSNESDRLDVVYSTDCSTNWNSIWHMSGAALATLPPDTLFFYPQADSEYVEHSVSLDAVPQGAMLGFEMISDFGNNLWLDDIKVRPGPALNAQLITTTSIGINLFPNPAKDIATLTFDLAHNSDVRVQVLDAIGHEVFAIINEKMERGAQKIEISTQNFPAGIYNVQLHTDNGTFTRRMSVIK